VILNNQSQGTFYHQEMVIKNQEMLIENQEMLIENLK